MDTRMKAIEERLAAIPPGDYQVWPQKRQNFYWLSIGLIAGGHNNQVAEVSNIKIQRDGYVEDRSGLAEFFAHSPGDMRYLFSQNEQLRAILKRLLEPEDWPGWLDDDRFECSYCEAPMQSHVDNGRLVLDGANHADDCPVKAAYEALQQPTIEGSQDVE